MKKRQLRDCAARARTALSSLLLAMAAQAVIAQEPAARDAASADSSPPAEAPSARDLVPLRGQPALPMQADATAHEVRSRTGALMLARVGGTLAYGKAKWWQDGFTGGFKTANEGWFGQGTASGGADKLGHAMFAYTAARLLTRGFEWAGNDSGTSLRLGLWTSVGTLMGVELIDGYSKKWRFSKEDALVDLAGGALGYWMETNPRVDALVDLRLQYSQSAGPAGRHRFDPFGDYSGQRYLVVFKAAGVPALKAHRLLRYVELSIGYGARDFETESRALVSPTRHVYYGVSLNLTELLRSTVFEGSARPSRTQRMTETFLEFVQVPAAAVEADHVIR